MTPAHLTKIGRADRELCAGSYKPFCGMPSSRLGRQRSATAAPDMSPKASLWPTQPQQYLPLPWRVSVLTTMHLTMSIPGQDLQQMPRHLSPCTRCVNQATREWCRSASAMSVLVHGLSGPSFLSAFVMAREGPQQTQTVAPCTSTDNVHFLATISICFLIFVIAIVVKSKTQPKHSCAKWPT